MKKTVILLAFLFSLGMLPAQENMEIIEKDAILELGEVSASGYQHIDFPRKNFILKRGAIANFNALERKKVVVKEVRSENGATKVTLERRDGLPFFRFWSTVEADLEKALVQGELVLVKPKSEESLAR